MNEIQILFSGAMVRAILDCSKTQTRRVVKPQPEVSDKGNLMGEWLRRPLDGLLLPRVEDIVIHSPYGQAGDRLWVRETFFAYGRWETRFSQKKGRDEWHFIDMTCECGHAYQYAADSPDVPLAKGRGALPGWYRRPAIHMPRVACRILLEVKKVRVERLQSISDTDAIAEGVTIQDHHKAGYCAGEYLPPSIRAYRDLWEQINGRDSWKRNPWVWCVSFDEVDPCAG